MPDWTKSMQQTFECYTVDPGTWKDIRPVNGFKSATVDRDSSSDTLGSASIDIAEDLGECYLRIYLVTIQNGLKERFPLGTFLAQTIPTSFDGKIQTISVDAYTPLIELKENPLDGLPTFTDASNCVGIELAISSDTRLIVSSKPSPTIPHQRKYLNVHNYENYLIQST